MSGSTYSPSLRLELIGSGEQAGNWGNTTNTNLGTLIEAAIAGVENVTMSGASTTLTIGNGVPDQSRNAVLVLGGTLSANSNLVIPSVEKVYIVSNATSGGFSVTVKTASGVGVTLGNGNTQIMYCNGSEVYLATVAVKTSDGSIGDLVFSSGSVVGNTTSTLFRVTQTGTGNAIAVEDSANPDATPFVVNADGRLVAGYTSSLTFNSNNYLGEFLATSTNFPLALGFTAASAVGPRLSFAKNRSADWSTRTVLSSGDTLGEVEFLGSDGTNLIPGARISSGVDATPGTNDMPGNLVLSTTADGAASPTERLRITSTGNVGINEAAPGNRVVVKSSVNGDDGVYYSNTSTGASARAVMRVSTSGATGVSLIQNYSTKNASVYLADNASLDFSTNATVRATILSTGEVGIGIATPIAQMAVYGIGQTSPNISTSTGLGGTLYLRDQNNAVGNGGAVIFGTTAGAFAGIKGLIDNGVGNTVGQLSFSTRGGTADATLTERARITASGDFFFNSGFGSAAVAYGCRAWVNFNGTTNVGGFCTIRASGNVTTVADNGTGDYTVNFSNPMPDANFAVVALGSPTTDGDTSSLRGAMLRGPGANLTTSTRVLFENGINANLYDPPVASVAVFR